jgi:hypothetical protein
MVWAGWLVQVRAESWMVCLGKHRLGRITLLETTLQEASHPSQARTRHCEWGQTWERITVEFRVQSLLTLVPLDREGRVAERHRPQYLVRRPFSHMQTQELS